jgi:thiol-disulfide isomerase/thioredoxin
MIAEGPPANLPPHIALAPPEPSVPDKEPGDFEMPISSRSLKLAVPAFGLVCALMLGGCDRQSSQPAQPAASSAPTPGASAEFTGMIDRSHKGSAVPSLTFHDTSGKVLQLAQLVGKPLLVNLWATWCAPCIAELPKLDALAATKGAALQVVTVSEDLTGGDKVATFLSSRGYAHLAPWLDPDNNASTRYQVSTLPTTIYYDASGHEVWRYSGGHDWMSAETAKMLVEGGG